MESFKEEGKRKGKNKPPASEIFEALESVFSYLFHLRDDRIKPMRGRDSIDSDFLLPVIVLQGQLFHAIASGDDLELEARNHIQLRTHWPQPKRDYGVFLVDVLTKEYFEEFLNLVKKEHENFVASIKEIIDSTNIIDYKIHGVI
jgi:hypothetical protein